MVSIKDAIDKGTTGTLSPIAHKTSTPPSNEEPLYIYTYKGDENTHIGAYYKGERLDYYPESITDAALSTLTVIGCRMQGMKLPTSAANVQQKYRSEANIPENESDIECYAIYPSQLGVSPNKLLKAIKEVKSDGSQYNFISNNCADQIEKVLNKIGIDTSNLQTFDTTILTMPANLNNFAKTNGYKVKFEDIPFNNDEKDFEFTLKWLKDPDEAYAELPDEYKTFPFTSLCLEIAKNKPEELAKKVVTLMEKNKKLNNSHLMYRKLCLLPEKSRQTLIDNGINDVLKDINPLYALHTTKSDNTTPSNKIFLAEILKNQAKKSLKNSQKSNNRHHDDRDNTNIDKRIKAKKRTPYSVPDLVNGNISRG